jgi:hypothetical protein
MYLIAPDLNPVPRELPIKCSTDAEHAGLKKWKDNAPLLVARINEAGITQLQLLHAYEEWIESERMAQVYRQTAIMSRVMAHVDGAVPGGARRFACLLWGMVHLSRQVLWDKRNAGRPLDEAFCKALGAQMRCLCLACAQVSRPSTAPEIPAATIAAGFLSRSDLELGWVLAEPDRTVLAELLDVDEANATSVWISESDRRTAEAKAAQFATAAKKAQAAIKRLQAARAARRSKLLQTCATLRQLLPDSGEPAALRMVVSTMESIYRAILDEKPIPKFSSQEPNILLARLVVWDTFARVSWTPENCQAFLHLIQSEGSAVIGSAPATRSMTDELAAPWSVLQVCRRRATTQPTTTELEAILGQPSAPLADVLWACTDFCLAHLPARISPSEFGVTGDDWVKKLNDTASLGDLSFLTRCAFVDEKGAPLTLAKLKQLPQVLASWSKITEKQLIRYQFGPAEEGRVDDRTCGCIDVFQTIEELIATHADVGDTACSLAVAVYTYAFMASSEERSQWRTAKRGGVTFHVAYRHNTRVFVRLKGRTLILSAERCTDWESSMPKLDLEEPKSGRPTRSARADVATGGQSAESELPRFSLPKL